MSKRSMLLAGRLVLALACLGVGVSLANGQQKGPQDVRETISMRGFFAIQAALPELQRNVGEVDGYSAVVSRSGSELFVTFGNPRDASANPPPVGCPGPR